MPARVWSFSDSLRLGASGPVGFAREKLRALRGDLRQSLEFAAVARKSMPSCW